MSRKLKISDILLPLSSIALLILMWIFLSSENSEYFPTPEMTFARLQDLFEYPVSQTSVFGHIWASIQRVLVAFLLATVVGVILGVAMGWNKKIRAALYPLIEIIRPIPAIAWIPLIILLMGVGEEPKVLLVFIGAVMPVILNTMAGVRFVEPMYLQVSRVFKASTLQTMVHVVFPNSIPAIFAGLKVALGTGWMIVVAAEMIASRTGLGFLINRGSESNDVALVLLSMILIGVVGAIISLLLTLVERGLCPWNNKKNNN